MEKVDVDIGGIAPVDFGESRGEGEEGSEDQGGEVHCD